MTTPPLDLAQLRHAIDSVDDAIHDLIVRRGELVAQVGRSKSATEAPIYRPAREAQIMRRLIARHSEPAEQDRVVRIWRAIMAASFERQGGLRVVADPRVEWIANGHFCLRGPVAAEGPGEALGKVLAGNADLAVVSTPTPFSGADWLPRIVHARQAGMSLYVLGRLPFFALPGLDAQEALVFGRGFADPSGDDVTLVAAAAAPPGALPVWFAAPGGGLSLFAFAEYVKADDPRLAGAVWLGAYARPLDPGGPRPLEFALRP